MKYLVKFDGPNTTIEAIPENFELPGGDYVYEHFSDARMAVLSYFRDQVDAINVVRRKFRQMKKHQAPRRVVP